MQKQTQKKLNTLILVLVFLAGLLLFMWPIAADFISYRTDANEYESMAVEYRPPEPTPVPIAPVIPDTEDVPEEEGSEPEQEPTGSPTEGATLPEAATSPEPYSPGDEQEAQPVPEQSASSTPSEQPDAADAQTGAPVSPEPETERESQTTPSTPESSPVTAVISPTISPTAGTPKSNTAVPTAVPTSSPIPTAVAPTPTSAAEKRTEQPTAVPSTPTTLPKAGVDLSACLAQNKDFVAWITIPGTKIDYPVVRSNDTEYYLHHMFSGKESQLGCLFSLKSSDYRTPSRNIAIYGHHLSQSDAMFSTLLRYKDASYCASHSTIRMDSLYGSREYRVFAVVNMLVTDWDAATASFSSDAAFLRFTDRARQQALFDTGVRVDEDDHILTLITCDRSYGGVSGRLIVMAVQQ